MPSRRADGTRVFKVVVYGPSMSEKIKVFKWIHGKKGSNIIKIRMGQTILQFFDRSLTKDSNVVFQVITVTGQQGHQIKRENLLKGADAIIFTWDSLLDQWKENVEGLKELLSFLGEKLIPTNTYEPADVVMVVLATKRNLEDIVEIPKIRKVLDIAHLNRVLIYETIVDQGINITRAVIYACRQAVLNHYRKLGGKPLSHEIEQVENAKYNRLELEKINKIKKLVLELGIKFTRLEIREIGEKSSIDDEDIIIEVVKDMIKNKEIYAEYFSSSKAIAFDQQANIEEIDKLMATYKEWEEKEVGKK